MQHKIANRVTGKRTERERVKERDGQIKSVSVVLRDIVRHRKGLCVYLEVSPLQVQELGAADVVADEGLFVFSQAELLQPDGHLLSAPPLNYTSTEREAPFSVQPPYTRRTQANRVRPRGGTSQKQPQKEKGTKIKSNRKEKTQREVAAAAGKERVKQVRFGHWHTRRLFWHAGYHKWHVHHHPIKSRHRDRREREEEEEEGVGG